MKLSSLWKRTIVSDVVQGIIVGAVLAFVTVLIILPIAYAKGVNGWITMYGCGEPGSGIFLRAACGVVFFGPINVPQEAMYWTAKKDGAGQTLSGAHDYVLHFQPGGLPPNNAFWSLTMGDAKNHFVPNPINRYSVSNRSGLAQNPDGSVDIYIQNTAPAGTRPTGCLRQPWISYSGCACICRVKQFWTGSTRCRRSSKHNDVTYEA